MAIDADDVPPEAWEYVPVQIVIFGIGIVMLSLGSWLKTRINRRTASN